jgi:outer membrane lipopolysaccharide assembly protein LptE/RlpB
MTKLQTRFAVALVLLAGACGFSVQASAEGSTATARCNHTLAQYTDYAKQLGPFAERARQKADDNPLHLADVGYYNAELADAKHCIRNLSPIATASR